jgi:hypothetical protein
MQFYTSSCVLGQVLVFGLFPRRYCGHVEAASLFCCGLFVDRCCRHTSILGSVHRMTFRLHEWCLI